MLRIYFPMDANADGTGGDGGGGGDNNTPTPPTAEELQQLKDQLASERKEKAKLSGDLTKISEEVATLKKQTLKSKEDFKQLYEDSEKKVGELTTENTNLKSAFFHTTRVGAVKEEVMKLGIRSEALGDIETLDLDEVQVKVGDDKIIRAEGAKDFAGKVKTLKPHWFKAPNDPAFNPGGGAGGGGGSGDKVTKEQFQEAFRNRNKDAAHMAKYRTVAKIYDEQTRKKA